MLGRETTNLLCATKNMSWPILPSRAFEEPSTGGICSSPHRCMGQSQSPLTPSRDGDIACLSDVPSDAGLTRPDNAPSVHKKPRYSDISGLFRVPGFRIVLLAARFRERREFQRTHLPRWLQNLHRRCHDLLLLRLVSTLQLRDEEVPLAGARHRSSWCGCASCMKRYSLLRSIPKPACQNFQQLRAGKEGGDLALQVGLCFLQLAGANKSLQAVH